MDIDMLESQSCRVSRVLPSSCEQDSSIQWAYMKYNNNNNRHEAEAPSNNGKRRLENKEEDGNRRKPRISAYATTNAIEQAAAAAAGHLITIGSSSSSSFCSGRIATTTTCYKNNNKVLEELSGYQHQGGESSDSDSLFDSINLGRDISDHCLVRLSRAYYGSIALLNQSFRSLIRSGELYRLRRFHGVVEHWVYFSCHLVEWEAFDPVSRRWMGRLPRMTSNECFMCSDKESLAVGTELLVFGKEVNSHVVYRYSILTNSWSLGPVMNSPRCLFGSASLGHIAILAGGCDSDGNILSSAELYDSEKGTWETLPSMNKRRKMCSGVFMDGKLYIIGGIEGPESRLLTCGEEFDMKTRCWREIPNMSPVRADLPRVNGMPPSAEAPPLIAVVRNELYAADYAGMVVRKYNKRTRTWATVGRLPERAGSMHGWGLAFRACGDRLVVIGGPRSTIGEGIIEVNSWTPGNGSTSASASVQWELLGQKHAGSFVYNCAVMGC